VKAETELGATKPLLAVNNKPIGEPVDRLETIADQGGACSNARRGSIADNVTKASFGVGGNPHEGMCCCVYSVLSALLELREL